jgi:hypothetical protein
MTITSNPGDLTASVGYTIDAAWSTPSTNQTLKWGVDSTAAGGDIGPGTGTTMHSWTDQFSAQAHAISGANFKASGSSSSGGSGGVALNACDLNADGVVNSLDAQLEANMILGSTPCTSNIDGTGVCDAVVLQRVVNDAMGGTCVIGNSHSVSLTWTASTAPNVMGYDIYRASTSGGPYAKVTSSLVAGTSYTDNSVQSGQTYYYVATAMDNTSTESSYSNQGMAAVPNP